MNEPSKTTGEEVVKVPTRDERKEYLQAIRTGNCPIWLGEELILALGCVEAERDALRKENARLKAEMTKSKSYPPVGMVIAPAICVKFSELRNEVWRFAKAYPLGLQNDIAPMSKLAIEQAINLLKGFDDTNSRPSQPPQNVQAGDAVKGMREIVEMFEGFHGGRMPQMEFVKRFGMQPDKMETLEKILEMARLALSATGDAASSPDIYGISGLRPVDKSAFAEFEREMEEKVIPEIIASMRARAIAAAESRFKPLCSALGTEQTMHAAWRKRAEEAEAALATGDAAKGEDGELAGKVKELIAEYEADTEPSMPKMIEKKNRLNQRAAQILFQNAPAIVAAASNAERLKDATALLHEVVSRMKSDGHDGEKDSYCWQCAVATSIKAFLSPAPAQTPRDERGDGK